MKIYATISACLITAIIWLPQVHALQSFAAGVSDPCQENACCEADCGCCETGEIDARKQADTDFPVEQFPAPCEPGDGPCDCPATLKTVSPVTMIILPAGALITDDAPRLLSVPASIRPRSIPLSVIVQPPIV